MTGSSIKVTTSPSTSVQVSKKEVIWFASGILFGMITVVCCLEMIFLLSNNRPHSAVVTVTTTGTAVFPSVGGGGEGGLAATAVTPFNARQNIVSLPSVVTSTTALVDIFAPPSNSTKPALLRTVATIALAELGLRLAVRCIFGLPFRILAYGARRARVSLGLRRFLAPALRGGTRSLARSWQTLIKLYYKTSLSKIINRGKRFVKMLVPHDDHHHHHDHSDTTCAMNVDDEKHHDECCHHQKQ
jgi:hypothetical protein